MNTSLISESPVIIRFGTEAHCYLLVDSNRSILIDCIGASIRAEITQMKLPFPEAIVHTRVSEEQCREHLEFPEVPVYVPTEAEDMALLNDRFQAESRTVWGDDRNWDTRGAEKYGYAGALTVRPPAVPLNVKGCFAPKGSFSICGFNFKIINLHGAGKFAVGLLPQDTGIMFCGALMRAGGYLDNFYDSIFCYARNDGLNTLQRALGKAFKSGANKLLPLHGDIIEDPETDLKKLRKQLQKVLRLTYLDWEGMQMSNIEPIRETGGFRELLSGVFQNLSCGSIIVFIDKSGNAILLDPDPCCWLPTKKENVSKFNRWLDELERDAGLKKVEYALITHAHGDHVQYASVLKERYGSITAATADIAELLRHPHDYPYACLLPWYNFDFEAWDCDLDLQYEVPLKWSGGEILPIHTPGHANAHAGFFLEWHGHRIVCTGDTIQHGGGTPSVQMPIIYNDTAWPDLGPLVALKRIQALRPDWVICGHSRYFHDPDGTIIAELIEETEKVQAEVAKLVPEGDLFRAMDPQDFAVYRKQLKNISTHKD